MMRSYAEVRRAIAYLRTEQGDVDVVMPSLYTSRGGGRPPSKKEEGSAPEGASPPVDPAGVGNGAPNGNGAASVSGNGGNGNGANGNGAAKPPPANGMPDEDPFAKG